jgi:hypothetical protein
VVVVVVAVQQQGWYQGPPTQGLVQQLLVVGQVQQLVQVPALPPVLLVCRMT